MTGPNRNRIKASPHCTPHKGTRRTVRQDPLPIKENREEGLLLIELRTRGRNELVHDPGQLRISLGRYFGGISRAGIVVKYNQIANQIETDRKLKGRINRIREKILNI